MAIKAEIDAFISFLSKDDDSVVSRKFTASKIVRAKVDSEIGPFKLDPLASYEATEFTPESLVQNLDQAEPFALPEGWIDISLPGSDELILSIPGDWTHYADKDYLRLRNDDSTLEVIAAQAEDKLLTESDSDGARLFILQTTLKAAGLEFYSEHSADVELYSLNRGYVVRYAVSLLDLIANERQAEHRVKAVIVTPSGHEVFVESSRPNRNSITKRDDFAQIDLLQLGIIYGSIRSPKPPI
jgi:hypothetical protein